MIKKQKVANNCQGSFIDVSTKNYFKYYYFPGFLLSLKPTIAVKKLV